MQPVAFAEIVTDIYRQSVNVRRSGSRSNEARRAGGIEGVSPWNQFDEFPDDGVCDGRALGVAQDKAIQVNALSLAQNFVIKEKEGAILAASEDRAAFSEARQVDWAADCAAELIALEGRRPRRGEVKKVTRIERIVPEEFIQLAVELLCAGARRNVDDAPLLRPYSALKVELSILNSRAGERRVEEEKVNHRSLIVMPLIWKLTVSSRLPAVLRPKEPPPRVGGERKPFCGGVTEPGMSRAKSVR